MGVHEAGPNPRRRHFLGFSFSVSSALLLIFAFPRWNLSWLAAVALAPILIACAREASWRWRFLYGWSAGTVFWCGTCPWIQFVLEVHGGMGKWGGWGSFLLFGLYKGLPMAVFAGLTGYVIGRWWAIPGSAALWTGLERLHSYMGFAWLDLGNAGINMPLPMRLAPFTGVYGLSFVFAMLGCAVAVVFLRRGRRELMWLILLAVLLALPRAPRPADGSERALLVQPNFDTEMTWTAASLEETKQKLATLSRASGAKLIVWPEVPAPFYIDQPQFREYAAKVAETSDAHFLFGAVAFTPAREPLNSAVLMDPTGKLLARYDKVNLVPFGEFIPPFFSWVNRITQEAGDFIPGTSIAPLSMDGHKIGAFICYESALPHFVREFVHQGAAVLVNLSNDGYFGDSEAHEQHLSIVRMRAAENRRWILRATNDGITATIDPRGRVVDRLVPFEQVAALMPFAYLDGETFYTRMGDWFAWSCLALGAGLAVLGGRQSTA